MSRLNYFLSPLLFCVSLYAQAVQRQPQTPSQTPPQAPEAPPPVVKPEDKCSIEGTVVSATTGEPLKKAHLTLRPIGQQNGVPYGTTTDNAGHFLIDDVDPGRYSFFAARNGFGMQAYSPRGNMKQTTTLTLANGQKLTEIVFKLTPSGVITGHVVDQDGEALAHVQIQCMRFVYQRGRRQLVGTNSAMSNDLGEFRMFDLSPGKYVISARYQSPMYMDSQERVVGSPQAVQAAEEGYPTLYYPNATNPDGASQIEVSAGAQIHGIDMVLVRARMVRVKGHVNVGATIRQPRNITLQLTPRDSGMMMNTPGNRVRVLDTKGNFEVRGVAPGSYYLIGNYADDSQYYMARIPVDVGNTNLEGVEVNLQPPAEIKGSVVVEENGDLKGATLNVNLQPKSTGPFMGGSGGPVKDDLTFTLRNVGPDPYDINVFGLPEGFYLKSIRIGDQDVTETGADFTHGVPAGEMTVVINPNGGQIEGTVQNAKGENAISASVTLIPGESHRSIAWLYKSSNTDQNGHFKMTGVCPGEYKIFAWEEIEAGAYQDPDFLKPHESDGKAVSVKDSGHETVQLTVVPMEKSR